MNKDYIVLSIQGQRLNTLPEEKLQKILAKIASVIVLNIEVEPRNVRAMLLTEEELLKTSIAQHAVEVEQHEERQIAEKAAVIYICEKFMENRKFNRYKFITSLLKSASPKDEALLNAVTIIANPSFDYDDIVDRCGIDTVTKYGFTRPIYQQVKMAYSLII